MIAVIGQYESYFLGSLCFFDIEREVPSSSTLFTSRSLIFLRFRSLCCSSNTRGAAGPALPSLFSGREVDCALFFSSDLLLPLHGFGLFSLSFLSAISFLDRSCSCFLIQLRFFVRALAFFCFFFWAVLVVVVLLPLRQLLRMISFFLICSPFFLASCTYRSFLRRARLFSLWGGCLLLRVCLCLVPFFYFRTAFCAACVLSS